MAAEISREEFEMFRHNMETGLARVEAKLDESIKCQYKKISRDECQTHRDKVWKAIEGLKRIAYITLGVATFIVAVVLPIAIALLKR